MIGAVRATGVLSSTRSNAVVKFGVSEPRKHHYVPVFYQKHFVNQHGLLWVYDRSLGTCKELHPASVCCEKDFYTVRPKDAPWDRRVETEIFNLVDGAGSTAL